MYKPKKLTKTGHTVGIEAAFFERKYRLLFLSCYRNQLSKKKKIQREVVTFGKVTKKKIKNGNIFE